MMNDFTYIQPLHFAAGFNRLAVVEYLLENGADVHKADKGGLVPLHNSASYGHTEVTELLIKYGANVNVADLWKFTPLHEAAAKGKYDIVKLLLKVNKKLYLILGKYFTDFFVFLILAWSRSFKEKP